MPTDARQGMEGAKNAYRGFQEAKRADTPNQGLSGVRLENGNFPTLRELS